MPDQDAATTTKTIENAIQKHHVIVLDYTDRNGHRSTIEAEPYAFRRSSPGLLELWIWALGPEHWESLHPDRIHSAQDTGRVFTWRPVLPSEIQDLQ